MSWGIPFRRGQKGSSSMPHTRNPVLTENLCGLARLVRSAVTPALEVEKTWAFYSQAMNLWVVGLAFLIVAVNVFVIVVSGFVAMAIGTLTAWLVTGYWKTLNGYWRRSKRYIQLGHRLRWFKD